MAKRKHRGPRAKRVDVEGETIEIVDDATAAHRSLVRGEAEVVGSTEFYPKLKYLPEDNERIVRVSWPREEFDRAEVEIYRTPERSVSGRRERHEIVFALPEVWTAADVWGWLIFGLVAEWGEAADGPSIASYTWMTAGDQKEIDPSLVDSPYKPTPEELDLARWVLEVFPSFIPATFMYQRVAIRKRLAGLSWRKLAVGIGRSPNDRRGPKRAVKAGLDAIARHLTRYGPDVWPRIKGVKYRVYDDSTEISGAQTTSRDTAA